jgi:hypothetical protein
MNNKNTDDDALARLVPTTERYARPDHRGQSGDAVSLSRAQHRSAHQSLVTVLSSSGQSAFAVVTSLSVSQLLAYYRDPIQRMCIRKAQYLFAANPVSARLVFWLVGVRLQVSSGKALLRSLMATVIAPLDRVVIVVGAPSKGIRDLQRYPCVDLHEHVPGSGPNRIEEAVVFVESVSPFRYCFLAVASPHRELIAHRLQVRGVARGLALCMDVD